MKKCIWPWLALSLLVGSHAATAADFDLVITGGRVMDPDSGFDVRANVGIRDGRIAAVTSQPLSGEEVIDAAERVVAPGFIDLHTHSPTPLGQRYQLHDGVTTALELEAGAWPSIEYARDMQGRARQHFGASVGHGNVRAAVMSRVKLVHALMSTPEALPGQSLPAPLDLRATFTQRASPAQIERMRDMLREELEAGALGVGVPLDYFSAGVSLAELRMVFELVAEQQTLAFVHLRRGINGDPAGLREVLTLARETGAAVHICHIQHNAMRNIDLFLDEIANARAEGVDVSTELLPYNAGSALISSAVFGRDWRTIFDIDYDDVEWAATGMRFDAPTFEQYRRDHPEGQVVHHYVRDEWTRRALVEPGVIVVSDLLPMIREDQLVAPHNGAFARVIGHYAREEGLLSLMEALSRMTSLPAQRLSPFFPAFERKGRIQVGADADLVIFDPREIIDRATYGNPYQASAGIDHVIVGGRVALRDGDLVEDVHAGVRLRAGPD